MRKLLYAIARPLLPVRLTSRLYLADRLAGFGVDVRRIPTPCMQELANDVITAAKKMATLSGQRWREVITDRLAAEARDIAMVMNGTYDYGGTAREYGNRIRSILKKHGVRLS